MAGYKTVPRTYGIEKVPIISVNYDYIPMAIESPKTIWVDLLMGSAPSSLRVGTKLRIRISPIALLYSDYKFFDNKLFIVDDIYGSRVSLRTAIGHGNETDHARGLSDFQSFDPYYRKSPFGWGIDTSLPSTPNHPNIHNIKYGFGTPIGYIEYLKPTIHFYM